MALLDATHTERKRTLSRGFELYQMYIAINLHFNNEVDYDFEKYDGKVRGSIYKFNKSPAKHRYCAIARQCDRKEFKAALYSIYKAHNDYVPERSVTPKNIRHHIDKINNDLSSWETTRYFEDIQSIKDEGVTCESDVMEADGDEAPLIFRKYLADEIDWKTVANFCNDNRYNRDRLTHKYKNESFFPIIKIAFDSLEEKMYFMSPSNHYYRSICRHRNIDWSRP